jgi:hypothetical protein
MKLIAILFTLLLTTQSFGATTVNSGTKSVTTAGTQVALVSSSTNISSVIIQANPANTGYIFVGDSTVDSSSGVRLSAGEKLSIVIDPNHKLPDALINLNTIYIDSSVDAEGVRFFYLKPR